MYITSPDLVALPGIRHAFFTRNGGVSEGLYASLNGGMGSADDKAHVMENRARMANVLGVAPSHLLGLYQVHSADVIEATVEWPAQRPGDRPRADAMVTRQKGIALGVASADCGPILFADGEAGVVGAAHSGWKGAFTGIGEATLAAMERLGAQRDRIVAVLGPTISANAYEVGPEFMQRFTDVNPDDARFFTPSLREHHAMFDLPAYITHRFKAAGIGRFIDLALCTYGNPEQFYSYRMTTHRGEPDYGRLLSAIALV